MACSTILAMAASDIWKTQITGHPHNKGHTYNTNSRRRLIFGLLDMVYLGELCVLTGLYLTSFGGYLKSGPKLTLTCKQTSDRNNLQTRSRKYAFKHILNQTA